MKRTSCINCSSSNLKKFIDLGTQPNGNSFPSGADLDKEILHPCSMIVCTDCWQVQLAQTPPAETLFNDHPYITGINKPVVRHMQKLAQDIVNKLGLKENSLVLDIGANDGTLLSIFRSLGMRTFGVDPCKTTCEIATKSGVNVLQNFWNEETARSIKENGMLPDLITATAVFYHNDDIHSFIRGLNILMKDDSFFIAQCVYLKDAIEKLQFDHFYHEHSMIHALAPLQRIFKQHGLKMIDVEFDPIHGGSFILYISKETSSVEVNESVHLAIEKEKQAGLNEFSTYQKFTKSVELNKTLLIKFLQKLKAECKTIFGLGAPVKGSTLLNYYGIGPEMIDKIVEINDHKIGRFTPGTHIPIVSESDLDTTPDYYLVLTWNFLDYLVGKYNKFLDSGGKFIVPHPTPMVIGADAFPVNIEHHIESNSEFISR